MNHKKMATKYEQPSFEGNPAKLSSTKLSVDSVLDSLLDKYAPFQKTGVEKGRGALIPATAAGATTAVEAGVKLAAQIEPSAVKLKPIAEAAASLGVNTGAVVAASNIIEKAASLLPIVTAVPGPVISGTTSAVGSGAVSIFQRLIGENAFKLYAKYSHIEEGSNLADKVSLVNKPAGFILKKGMWVGKQVSRGAERAVLNMPEFGGIIKMNSSVQDFVDSSNDDSFYARDDINNSISEAFYYLLTAKATEQFGAYFTPEEKMVIEENSQVVTKALEKVLDNSKLYEQQSPEEILVALEDSIARIESWTYFKEATAVTVISGVKGALMFSLIELILKTIQGIKFGIMPGIRPKTSTSDLTPQAAQAPAYATQHNDVTVPVPDSVYQSSPKLGPDSPPSPIPSPFPFPWRNKNMPPQGMPQPAEQPVPNFVPQSPKVRIPDPDFGLKPDIIPQPTSISDLEPGLIPDRFAQNIPNNPTIPPIPNSIPETSSLPSLKIEPIPAASQPAISATGLSGAQTLETAISTLPTLTAEQWALISPANIPAATGEAIIRNVVNQSVTDVPLAFRIGSDLTAVWQAGGGPQLIQTLQSMRGLPWDQVIKIGGKLLFQLGGCGYGIARTGTMAYCTITP